MRAIARSEAGPWASAAAVLFLGLALAAPARGQAPEPEAPDEEAAAPLVERVEIARNQFPSGEALAFYISTKPGDRYDQLRLREDFRRLWDTGFVDDLSIDVRDSPSGGKVITFVVSERKRIQIVDFRGSKALSKSTIEDELKKKDAALKVDTFYDLGKTRHVEHILREMLADKGRPFATVRHDAKPVGSSGLQVSLVVDDGPKAKAKRVAFVGNHAFSDATLAPHMTNIPLRRHTALGWLLGPTTCTSGQ